MKKNHSATPSFKEKRGINIAALIICFTVAFGIWLYAQAIDDDINVETYNQLSVEYVGGEAFKEATGYDVYSLSEQKANITISGTNRELVKLDAQNIRLIADVSATNNGVASIKAYVIDDKGTTTELKNVEITPAVVTVRVSKQVEYSIQDITENLDTTRYSYTLDENTTIGTISVRGTVQDVDLIQSVVFQIDYQNLKEQPGQHNVSLGTATFYDAEGNALFNGANPGDIINFTSAGMSVSLTIVDKEAQSAPPADEQE